MSVDRLRENIARNLGRLRGRCITRAVLEAYESGAYAWVQWPKSGLVPPGQCLYTAAHSLRPDSQHDLALALGFKNTIELIGWNDALTTTYEMVLARLYSALAAQETDVRS